MFQILLQGFFGCIILIFWLYKGINFFVEILYGKDED